MKPESSQSFSLHAMAHAAREAAKVLAEAKSGQKDSALVTAAVILRERSDEILAANARDMEAARAQGLDAAMLDRLRLDVARIEAMQKAGFSIAGHPIRDVVTVNGVRVTVDDGTWGLIRASSNKPELVVVIESPVSEARMREMFKAMDAILREHREVGAYNQTI